MARPLLECPDHWFVATLEPDPSNGIILSVDNGDTPSTRNPDNWGGGIPWLTPKEISRLINGVYVSKTERTITQQGLENSGAKLMPPETVMLTKRAPVGAVAINAVPMATNQGFLNLRCGGRLRPLYLAYWFRVNTRYLQIVANGSTYPELYQMDLFEFEIAVPPLEEQDAILNTISALNYVSLLAIPLQQSVATAQGMIRMQKLSRRLHSLRNAILPKLVSGELDATRVSTGFLGGFHDL
jgi:hypothetical protein